MTTETQISKLVCTRISHDIVGNIGAVANAVELLEEGDMDFMDDIKSILKTSSKVLSSRVKFFRLAFGLENTNLNDWDIIKKTTEDYLETIGNKNHPISFEIKEMDIKWGRIILLSTFALSDIIIKGGWIKAEVAGGKLYVGAQSNLPPAAEKTDTIKEIVAGKNEEAGAQYAPLYYLKKVIEENGYSLSFFHDDLFGFIIG